MPVNGGLVVSHLWLNANPIIAKIKHQRKPGWTIISVCVCFCVFGHCNSNSFGWGCGCVGWWCVLRLNELRAKRAKKNC